MLVEVLIFLKIHASKIRRTVRFLNKRRKSKKKKDKKDENDENDKEKEEIRRDKEVLNELLLYT